MYTRINTVSKLNGEKCPGHIERWDWGGGGDACEYQTMVEIVRQKGKRRK